MQTVVEFYTRDNIQTLSVSIFESTYAVLYSSHGTDQVLYLSQYIDTGRVLYLSLYINSGRALYLSLFFEEIFIRHYFLLLYT